MNKARDFLRMHVNKLKAKNKGNEFDEDIEMLDAILDIGKYVLIPVDNLRRFTYYVTKPCDEIKDYSFRDMYIEINNRAAIASETMCDCKTVDNMDGLLFDEMLWKLSEE